MIFGSILETVFPYIDEELKHYNINVLSDEYSFFRAEILKEIAISVNKLTIKDEDITYEYIITSAEIGEGIIKILTVSIWFCGGF